MSGSDRVAGAATATHGDVLVLVGPTASGKSEVAMQVARERPGVELVAVDAFTIYRGMDVGTAKPSQQDRADVAHHLIDILDPSQDVNVAWFQATARAAVDDVLARGRTPLLVGGAGLYYQAVVDRLDFPPTEPTVRARILQQWADDPRGAHAHLAHRDPDAAARIEPDNLRRTVRALEVMELTGRPFSSFGAGVASRDPHYSIHAGVVLTLLPEVLRDRIDQRAQAMVDGGLLDEARALREQGPLSRTAAQAIGYREAFAVLEGRLAPDELAPTIARRTRAYARRQRAWFRRDDRLQALDATAAATLLRTGVR